MNAIIKAMVLVILVLCSGCVGCGSKVLRYEDIATPKVTYENGKLYVEGAIIHSALGVKCTKVTEEGDVFIVKSYLSMSHANLYLLYSVCVDVPDRINEVKFGDAEKTIWKRLIGPYRADD